ncbi:MAG: hypothetical protein HY054_01590 [Proteobacteria bacterium]|nr:hypothetical protein [Pseudomonadota bacterium]
MTRVWPIATAALGVATLAILVAFSTLPDVRAAYPNGDFSTELNAFQHATSMSQLDALFGSPADPAKLRAMTSGNTLDLFGFIPAYGLFMIAGAAMLADGLRKPVVWLALAPALVGIAGDIVETTSQLRMTHDWAHASAALPLVAPACWTKFFGIALHALGCSAICFIGERKRWILVALGSLPVLGVSADALHILPAPSLMSAILGAFWIALLVVGVLESVRPKPA